MSWGALPPCAKREKQREGIQQPAHDFEAQKNWNQALSMRFSLNLPPPHYWDIQCRSHNWKLTRDIEITSEETGV